MMAVLKVFVRAVKTDNVKVLKLAVDLVVMSVGQTGGGKVV